MTSSPTPNLFCECSDDRCAGYHHAVGDPCGCFMLPPAPEDPVEAVEAEAARAASPLVGRSLDAAVAAEVRAEIARHKGASVSALAARLGMRRATLAGRVAGDVAFRPAELHHLARALDTSASAIVARAERRRRAGEPLADGLAGALRSGESVEAACEEALAGGRCGVAVVEGVPIVDPAVPYGALWEFPTPEAYRAGCAQPGGAS